MAILLTAFVCTAGVSPAEQLGKEASQQQTSNRDDHAPAVPDEADLLFRDSLKELFPLTPDQNRKTLQESLDQERSSRLPAPAGLQTRSRSISLQPGAPIETVRLRRNYPSTIVFLDSTGQPWPIMSVVVGNDDWVEVHYDKESRGNVLTVTPKTYEANTSIILLLEPSVPVNLQLLIETQSSPDLQLTLRADCRGPKAVDPIVTQNYPDTVDKTLLDFLYGIPPAEAKSLPTDNPQVEGWILKESMYVRTPWPVVWPSFESTTANGNGETKMYAYKLPRFPQIQLAQDDGQPIFVTIE